MVVPARAGDGDLGVYVVGMAESGVGIDTQSTTAEAPTGYVMLEGATAERLAGASVDELVNRALVGASAMQLGLAEAAVRMTAKYATERKQFGQPIGAFQAVGQRVADAFIDTQSMKVSLWLAAWQLDEGIDASGAAQIAKFWADDGGHRVVAAAQHVHGGTGFDRDYPLHRYFLRAKDLEFTYGGASSHLAALGESLAARTPQN